jgi:hypothetical protein
LPGSLPAHPTPLLAVTKYSERTASLGSGQWKSQTGNWFWFKLLDSLRLNFHLPELGSNPFSRAVVQNTVLTTFPLLPGPRSGGASKYKAPWARGMAPPEYLIPGFCASVHQTQHHSPRMRGGRAAPPGGRRRASRRLYSVRPYPLWVVGVGSGRVPGPKFAAGTATGAASGFLGHREGQKPVGFCPLGGAHFKARGRYTLCSAIHRAEGVRWAPGGGFRKCVFNAEDTRYELELELEHKQEVKENYDLYNGELQEKNSMGQYGRILEHSN